MKQRFNTPKNINKTDQETIFFVFNFFQPGPGRAQDTSIDMDLVNFFIILETPLRLETPPGLLSHSGAMRPQQRICKKGVLTRTDFLENAINTRS